MGGGKKGKRKERGGKKEERKGRKERGGKKGEKKERSLYTGFFTPKALL